MTVRVRGGLDGRMPQDRLCHRSFAADQDRIFASDPSLGRILAAIGYAGVEDLDVNAYASIWENFWSPTRWPGTI